MDKETNQVSGLLSSREQLRVRELRNVNRTEFFKALNDLREQIVGLHFAGHGQDDALFFNGGEGDEGQVRGEGFVAALTQIKNLRFVFLNCCHSATIAERLRERGLVVLGTTRAIADQAALRFAVALYQGLIGERSLAECFEMAKAEMSSLPETALWRDFEMRASSTVGLFPYQAEQSELSLADLCSPIWLGRSMQKWLLPPEPERIHILGLVDDLAGELEQVLDGDRKSYSRQILEWSLQHVGGQFSLAAWLLEEFGNSPNLKTFLDTLDGETRAGSRHTSLEIGKLKRLLRNQPFLNEDRDSAAQRAYRIVSKQNGSPKGLQRAINYIASGNVPPIGEFLAQLFRQEVPLSIRDWCTDHDVSLEDGDLEQKEPVAFLVISQISASKLSARLWIDDSEQFELEPKEFRDTDDEWAKLLLSAALLTKGIKQVDVFLPFSHIAQGVAYRQIPLGAWGKGFFHEKTRRVHIRSWDRAYDPKPQTEMVRNSWMMRWRQKEDSPQDCAAIHGALSHGDLVRTLADGFATVIWSRTQGVPPPQILGSGPDLADFREAALNLVDEDNQTWVFLWDSPDSLPIDCPAKNEWIESETS